jgi:hypothetical protein
MASGKISGTIAALYAPLQLAVEVFAYRLRIVDALTLIK